jgi:hypothetical protein
MDAPFFAKMNQPMRGIVGTIMTFIIGSLIVVIPLYFWKPWGVNAATAPAGMDDLDSIVQLGMYCGAGLFAWIFWWTFHMGNWPFQKIPQPLQGLLVGSCAMVGGWITYYILHSVLKWDADVFNISVLWLMWVYILGPWGGMPLATAYEQKQPVCGISGFIASYGLGLLVWWFLPEEFHGYIPGFPFVWFLIATAFALTLNLWPFARVKQPQQLILLVGYLSFFSFIYIWIAGSFGLNFFATIAANKAGALPDLGGSTFTVLWLFVILIPVGLFQFWPFHNMPNVIRGFLYLIVTLIITLLLWQWLLSMEPAAPAPAVASVVHFRWVFLILDWLLALFVGWSIVWCNCCLFMAPPPAGAAARH